MSPTEGPAARRFARLVSSPRVRRLSPARLGVAAVISAVFVLLGLLLFSNGLQSARTWLHRQPQYQLRFSEIALDPDPPLWLRGRAPVFLDRIREATGWRSDSFSVLDLPPKDLYRVFELNCWVEKVYRVEVVHPNQVRVQLKYREPVALPRVTADFPYLLDRGGSLLPARDVDKDLLLTLIPIHGLDPPVDPEPGKAWKTGDPAHGAVEKDPRAVAAGSLASFLLGARQGAAQSSDLPQIVCIYSMKESGLFVRCGDDIWVHWNHAPGEEPPGQPSAEAKWALLCNWFETHAVRTLAAEHYLDFSKNEIVERVGKKESSGGR